jgi:hypothetical protein
MLTPFEAGKTAEELGIGAARTFVVVGDWKGSKIKKGDIVTLHRTDGNSKGAYFKRLHNGKIYFFPFYLLAYAPQSDVSEEKHALRGETRSPGDVVQVHSVEDTFPLSSPTEEYTPQVGDVVSVQAVVTYASEQGRLVLAFAGTQKNAGWKVSFEKEESPALNLTLIARKVTTEEIRKLSVKMRFSTTLWI